MLGRDAELMALGARAPATFLDTVTNDFYTAVRAFGSHPSNSALETIKRSGAILVLGSLQLFMMFQARR